MTWRVGALAGSALLFLGSVFAEEPAASAGPSEDLATLACEAGKAYARRDLAALERLSAPDYVQTDVRGGVLRRAEWLEFVKNRKSDLTIACEDVSVRHYGDAAVVTGEWIYTSHAASGDSVTRSRWTSVWTREAEAGGWKRHVFQNTYENPKADRCALGLPH
jgi:ketosteroid isomerase-like protein